MLSKDAIMCKLNKIEYYYFYFFLAVNLLPILAFKFFPTVDGPAHLYNSRLMIELLGNNNLLHNYFIFNQIGPNWLGHIILGIFLLKFPAYIAEKCILLIYFIGFPVSFRALIKTKSNTNKTLIYFVFPFTYSFLLYYGFYNFHIGLVFFFCALYFWVKYNNEFTIKRALFLLILTTLMCLSHLFVFVVYIFVAAIINTKELKSLFISNRTIKLKFLKDLIYKFISISVGLFMLIKFILANNITHSTSIYIKISSLLKWIMQIQPAKGILYAREDIFTKWILISFILIISYLLFIKTKRFILAKRKEIFLTSRKTETNFWFLISCVLLVSLFIIPDSKSGAFGFMSSRILLFFFLFLIVWLSTIKIPLWLNIIIFVIINYVNIALLNIYYNTTKDNNIIVNEINQASLKIEPYKTVLPIRNNDYWLYGHISNYLGVDKPMVILENYEASLNYFPLKWNKNEIPNLYFGETSLPIDCIFWVSNMNNDVDIIDYIFVWNGDKETVSNECGNKIINILEKDYIDAYKSTDNTIMLYRYKEIN